MDSPEKQIDHNVQEQQIMTPEIRPSQSLSMLKRASFQIGGSSSNSSSPVPQMQTHPTNNQQRKVLKILPSFVPQANPWDIKHSFEDDEIYKSEFSEQAENQFLAKVAERSQILLTNLKVQVKSQLPEIFYQQETKIPFLVSIKPLAANAHIQIEKFNPQTTTNDGLLKKDMGDAVAPAVEPTENEINEEYYNNYRYPCDIICVVDCSGSMQDNNQLDSVQKTLNKLVETLNFRDRLCLIKFNSQASRVTPLLHANTDNSTKFKAAINDLQAAGGTNINSALYLALEVVRQRKFQQNVTSIFLLTDGLEENAVKRVKESFKRLNIKDNFVIHTFGYGLDHDPKQMSEIAELADGNFYFVENTQRIDQCFIDAVADVFSVLAINTSLSIEISNNHPTHNIEVINYYGNMWYKINDQVVVREDESAAAVQKSTVIKQSILSTRNKDSSKSTQNLDLHEQGESNGLPSSCSQLQTQSNLIKVIIPPSKTLHQITFSPTEHNSLQHNISRTQTVLTETVASNSSMSEFDGIETPNLISSVMPINTPSHENFQVFDFKLNMNASSSPDQPVLEKGSNPRLSMKKLHSMEEHSTPESDRSHVSVVVNNSPTPNAKPQPKVRKLETKLKHLQKGSSKDYVLEIYISPKKTESNEASSNQFEEVQSGELEQKIFQNFFLKATLQIPENESDIQIHQISFDALQLLQIETQKTESVNEQGEIKISVLQSKPDPEVTLHLMRVRAADILKKSLDLSEKGRFFDAEQIIADIIQQIHNSDPYIFNSLTQLYEDLLEVQQNCNNTLFTQSGRFLMVSCSQSHMEQRSSGLDSQYQNNIQSQMVKMLLKNQHQSSDKVEKASKGHQQTIAQKCSIVIEQIQDNDSQKSDSVTEIPN